ncbi:MAG: YeeE/YedE thiosulfate transporter family protein [Nitrospirota bacterium]
MEEKYKPLPWLWAGILLSILNVIIANVHLSDRLIGVSAAYPYFSGLLAGLTDTAYMQKIAKSGLWELYLLSGVIAGAFLSAVIRKDFRVRLIPERWREVKGESRTKRIFWAFIGGFLLLTGARLAGGCTSGHVLSGGMQLAISSLVFGACMFISLLITGKFFYRRRKNA